jgi:hypothetical protein
MGLKRPGIVLGLRPGLCQTLRMPQPLQRRRFLKVAAVTSTLPLARQLGLGAVQSGTANPASDTDSGLTVYQLGPQIWVRYNNRQLTCYRAHRSQKYPYLFPLTGPGSGLSLTDETALPYPHHRSVFFGCDRVNGGNYWQEGYETGQILSAGPKLATEAKDLVVIKDACDWQQPAGLIVMKDERQLSVTVPAENLRMIEWIISLHAQVPITVQKTNHSLFSMRAALDITPKGGGNLVNAGGNTAEKGTAGVRSAWCSFYGRRATMPDCVEGIAIFDHPRNPWAPTPWFTRDYGFASPTPLNFTDTPWTIPAGQSVTFRYAVVLYLGDPAKAGLDRLYRNWAATSPRS